MLRKFKRFGRSMPASSGRQLESALENHFNARTSTALTQVLDLHGRSIEPGKMVRVRSVDSCASSLPQEDQARLAAIVGRERPVAMIDRYGFVWLCFDEAQDRSDFCLKPIEVEVT